MNNEQLINLWRKRCLENGNIPIALVSVDKNGFPVVYSDHKSDILNKVFKHLADAPLLGESTHLDGREN
ncbi:MAG: hypothetical protein AABY22_36250 [Nanoarchaeota archaeon]